MALTEIELCSAALVKLGAAQINSFDEGTAEANVATYLFPITRDHLLSAHPWSFATTHKKIEPLETTTDIDFFYSYRIPDDVIRIVSAGPDGASRGLIYRIIGKELHTNADIVNLTYIYRPIATDIPPLLIPPLVTRLAAEFCLPLTENASRSDLLFKLADAELKLAKRTDSQQDTPIPIKDFILTKVRSS